MAVTIYELVDEQLLDGQSVLNVYHFVDPAGSTDVAGLVSNYVADVLPLLQPLQSTSLSHVGVKYRQVYPAQTLQLELAISPSINGTETGDYLATFYAASGKWVLANGTVNLVGGTLPHIRRGGVRIAGMVEANVVGDSVVSGYTTAWNAWVAELRNPGVGAFILCVASFLNVSRARQHTAQQYAVVTGASAPSPSTQNSRKVLRGRSF